MKVIGELYAEDEVGWHAVDFDGTVAVWHGKPGILGKPVPKMVRRVRRWLKKGERVKILTARVASNNPDRGRERKLIEAWCKEFIGKKLEVTSEKDRFMIDQWDDRVRQVKLNTGELVATRTALKAMAAGVRLANKIYRKVL